MATYSLSDYELRDLYVRDDNTVRFNLIAPNAQQKAANISQAVRKLNLFKRKVFLGIKWKVCFSIWR
jgi:hypothetical protein